ncbi:MAG: cytochrome C nitrite reductase [Gammaproteobacteria bacterium]|nr:cytochrome C nitrite reductase [Gammaproteobacteria bacterium]
MPGEPLKSFDIGFVNADGVYALADRSNRGLDFFDSATGRFLGRATGFKGFDAAGGSEVSGPNGVVAVGRHEFWAGDGDSTVKAVDLRTKKVIASIPTGGKKRADEVAYDARDHLLIAVNNADDPPFVTFISTRSHQVVGRLELKRASDGAEQPVWDPASGLLYISIPSLDEVKSRGAVAVIDPRTRKLLKFMPVAQCMPAGLALGPRDELLLGCSDDAIKAGFPARSFVMSAATGKIVATFPKVGGSDEVWSDLEAGRYYLAAVANTGGPVLGVADSTSNRWIGNWPTGSHAHSVAADATTGKVLVPIAAGSASDCVRGCIAVFGPRKD